MTLNSVKETLQRKYDSLVEYIESQKHVLDLKTSDIADADIIIKLYGHKALKEIENPQPNMPKPPVPKVNHYKSRLMEKQPDSIIARLYGLSESRSLTLGASNGLNFEYQVTTHNQIEVTDPNDIAFFIKKAFKNPELYEIVEPAGLIQKLKGNTEPKKVTPPIKGKKGRK